MWMLDKGKNTKKFFKVGTEPGQFKYTLKTAEEYAMDTRTEVGVHKVRRTRHTVMYAAR